MSSAPNIDRQAREATILRMATDAFATNGYYGASLREIAESCGMQKGHLSYYFTAKRDLLFRIIDDLGATFLHGIDTWANAPQVEPADRLRHVFTEHVRLVCDRQRQTRVTYESSRFLPPGQRRRVNAKSTAYISRIAELIEEHRGYDNIVDGPSTLIANVVLGILVWPYQWFDPRQHRSDFVADFVSHRAMCSLKPSP